jgi:hypothetical protein
MSNEIRTNEYFAKAETDRVGTLIKAKIEQYYTFMVGSGIFRRQYRAATHYFGTSPNSNASTDQIRQGGKHGQLSMIKVNHLRNIGQHLIQLTTSQKPAPMPVATNSDAKSQKQATVAKGVLDYYSKEKRIDRKLTDAVEFAVMGGEGFVVSGWDVTASSEIGKDDAPGNKKGDVTVKTYPSSEVIRDPNKQKYEDCDWVIVRDWISKYQVADKYANLEKATSQESYDLIEQIRTNIFNQGSKLTTDRTKNTMLSWMFNNMLLGDSDDIAIYTFFHRRSPSLPNGRMVVILEDGTVLSDSDLPFKNVPVRRICPADIIGSSFGYTPLFDLLVLQEAIDALYSAITTNQITFGVQLIMAMKGHDIDFRQLARGLSFLEYNDPQTKPEPLNLTHTPAEIFKFIQQLEGAMETISGVNAVTRGNVPDSQMSGSALALVQSQSISFSTGLQSSYAHLIEDVYTDLLNILKDYANDARTITIVGKYNRSMLQSFSKDDISDINRVTVEAVSALEQSVQGRYTMAQDLITKGLITNPKEYLSVIKTGNLDPMLEGDTAELMLIRSENEAMAANTEVHALPTDEHVLHIKEHRTVLSTPEGRENPALVTVFSNHILEHVQHLSDPSIAPLLSVLGQTPLQMAMMPQPGQGYNPGPGGPPAPNGPPGPPPGAPPVQPNPPMPRKPSMPKNPETGQKYDNVSGGGVNQPKPNQPQ